MVETAIPHLGDTIGGKYRVERALGRGGMGAVFEVTHCVTQKHFAIKWLMSEPSSSNDAVTRFVREAQVAGRCEHRNIVEVYDIDRHNGQLFMVMELLKGESLAERIMRCPSGVGYREACRLLVPCIEAIEEAHSSGIIHRDLKPANLFVCQARGREPEFAKVLDFGVSRFVTPDGLLDVSQQTRNGAIIGTPFYMAPEQMRGHAIDARADVYSMGVTLYETLSGTRPYDATSYGDLLLKVTDARPKPVADVVPGLPRPLAEVVARAMATDPGKRFATMTDLARALEVFAGSAIPHTPQLSWSAATQRTPLVSETSSVHELALSVGVDRSPRRLFVWFGLAAAVVAGTVAWKSFSDEDSNIVRAGPATTTQSAATSTPEPPSELPTAADLPEAIAPKQEPTTQPIVAPETIAPQPHIEPTEPTEQPNERGRAARRRRQAASENDNASNATNANGEQPRGGDAVSNPPAQQQKAKDAKDKRKARAPAHMQRDDF
jgi:serine/threonine-protein kinase